MTSFNSHSLSLSSQLHMAWSHWICQSLSTSFSHFIRPSWIYFLFQPMCSSMTYHFIFLLSPLILLATCPAFASVPQNLQPWINWNFCHSHCYTWIVESWKESLWISTIMSWWHSISPLSLFSITVLFLELFLTFSSTFHSIPLSLAYKHACLSHYKETLCIFIFHLLLAKNHLSLLHSHKLTWLSYALLSPNKNGYHTLLLKKPNILM